MTEKPALNPDPPSGFPVELEHFHPAQKFFHDLYVAARSPGYGDHHRQFVTNLLLRATEAGLYSPEAT